MSFPLSKSKLQSHHQCNKKLWLEVHQPKLAQADEFQQLNLDRGTAFGEAVRSLYPDGILVAEKNSQDAIAKTQHHLETFAAGQKPVPLFEATFSYNNVVVRVDVLIPAAQSAWELIEVKTGQLKPHYVRDAATQALVITKSNPTLTLTKICVGTPNRDFVYTSQNDYRGILTVVDVTNDARALFEAIASDIEPALRTLNLPDAPERTVGGQCTKPYACGFTYHCTGTNVTPEDRFIVPVWHLASSPLTKIVQKLLPTTRDLAQVDDCELIDATHRKMKEVALGKPYYLDPALQNFLSAQPFPRYFLDYEYTTPPIPLWLGTHPNERIAFQFSVHVWTAPDAPLEHFEFLASSNQDPRSELAQKLIEAITTPGPVFAWSGKQRRHRSNVDPEPLRTLEICRAAVKQNGWALEYVPEPLLTQEICRAAVKQNGWTLKYVPESLQTPELCLVAVFEEGCALVFVHEPLRTLEICRAAVEQNGRVLRYVPEPDRKIDV